MATTSIEWTDDTWNPVTGCDRVSAGCDHCYALTLAKRLKAMGSPRYQRDGKPTTSGPGFGVTLHADKLTDPLRWKNPRRVFVNSMSDLFHAHVPDYFIADVFAVMAQAKQHTFQVLTKRPQRMQRTVASPEFRAQVDEACKWAALGPTSLPGLDANAAATWPLPNVWLGTSVESQEVAWRIDWLVKTPAAVRFLSCEPLLGPLDLNRWLWQLVAVYGDALVGDEVRNSEPSGQIHWVITGGESGPEARPCDPGWVRSIRDQCVAADVAYFHKQWGGRTPKAGGRLLDNTTWDQFPVAIGAA